MERISKQEKPEHKVYLSNQDRAVEENEWSLAELREAEDSMFYDIEAVRKEILAGEIVEKSLTNDSVITTQEKKWPICYSFKPHEIENFMLMSERTKACATCVYVKRILSEKDSVVPFDLPLRNADWAKENLCVLRDHRSDCRVYSLIDWKFSKIHGRPSPGFFRNAERFVEAAVLALNLEANLLSLQGLSKKDQQKIRQDVSGNPYVIYTSNMRDNELADFEGNERFFSLLYRLRVKLGLNADYGYKVESKGMIAQNPVDETISGNSLLEMLKSVPSKIASGAKGFVKLVKDLVYKFFSLFSPITELISDKLKAVIEACKTMTIKMICKMIIPEKWYQKLENDVFRDQFIKSLIVFILVTAAVGGFMGYVLMERLIAIVLRGKDMVSKLSFLRETDGGMVAEGEMNYMHVITGVCMYGFGLMKGDTEIIKRRCLQMTAVMAGGTIMLNSANVLLCLLPTVIKRALIAKFGSEDDNLKYEVHEWRNQALALIGVSRTQSVIGTPYFQQKVEEYMKSGSVLLRKLHHSTRMDLKNVFATVYLKLLNLNVILTQKKYDSGTRKMPFAIHIAGPPGIGKSLFSHRLFEAAEIDESQIYSKACSDPYWSGFLNQPGILMDEFFEGEDTDKNRQALEYLDMVSTGNWKPNMASLDSPSVGIKGTSGQPRMVVSMNNTPYDRPTAVNIDAFQRRRKFVINVSKSKYYRGTEHGVDISKYSAEEIRSVKWAQFQLQPGRYQEKKIKNPWMSFDVLLRVLGDHVKEHEEVCEAIAGAYGGGMADNRSPEEVIDEVMRDCFELPTKPMSVGEAFMSLFVDNMEAEGPKEKVKNKTHTHKCCKTFRHNGFSFKCDSCGKEEDCPNLPDDEEIKEGETKVSRDDIVSVYNNESDGVHRHACVRKNCSKQKGCTQKDGDCGPPFVCPEHLKEANGYIGLAQMTNEGARLDDAFCENIEELRSEMLKLTFDGYNRIMLPLIDPDNIEIFGEEPFYVTSYISNTFLGTMKVGAYITLFVSVLLGIRRNVFGHNDCPDQVTFSAQSDKRVKYSTVAKTRGTFQRGASMNAQGQIPNYVSTLTIWYKDIERTIKVVPLKDKWVLTYHHSLVFNDELIVDGTPMDLDYKGTTYRSSYDDSKTLASPEKDIVLIYMGNTKIPAFKDITKRFITEDEINQFETVLVVMKNGESIKHSTGMKSINGSYRCGSTSRHLEECFKYPAQTLFGDCGTPVVIGSGPLVGKIIGIHVAGTTNKFDDPLGMCNIIYQGELIEALSMMNGNTSLPFCAEGPNVEEYIEKSSVKPNVVFIEKIQDNEMVHVPAKTKIKRSAIYGIKDHPPLKGPAIMSSKDFRAKGREPVELALDQLFEVDNPKVDVERVKEVFDTMYHRYNNKLKFPFGRRRLTFEEACGGVPGHLNSITVQTSPGYPLIHVKEKKGKTDFVWFDKEGNLGYTEEFKELVFKKLDEMSNYDGGEIDHVFMAYGKDELRSQSKLDKCSLRLIFANDMICLVAFRMLYGCILSAFQNSFNELGDAIGVNQYSYDMQRIYDYLREVGDEFIDGDCSEWDKRIHYTMREYAYGLLMRLAETYGVTVRENNFMYVHECMSPAQIGRLRFRVLSCNWSGKFWTTIINCLLNEGNVRYIFIEDFPTLMFDLFIRIAKLGDDHIICVSKLLGWTPKRVGELMKLVGQKYTSAFKDEELGDQCKKFEDILFLGARPRMLRGQWTGALRQETLWETVQWTRDHNLSLDMVTQQMIELSSQWGEEFYMEYVYALKEAYHDAGRKFVEYKPWMEISRIVAERGSQSGHHFYGHQKFIAEGPMEGSQDFMISGMNPGGLTSIKTSDLGQAADESNSDFGILAAKAINEQSMDQQYGQHSLIKRTYFDWSSTSVGGDNLLSIALPFGLLALGNQSNIQNMPWNYYTYAKADVEIVMQINGTPMQAGALLAYWQPLYSGTVDVQSRTMLKHCWLNPCSNTTQSLVIPFAFWRSVLNTYAGALGTESMGTFKIDCYSPLSTKVSPSTATVTVYSRFLNAKFSIPRPIPAASSVLYGPNQGSLEQEFIAEGANYSTTNVSNKYTLSNITGDIPIQTGAESRTGQGIDASATLPLDNPPMSGGSIPTHQVFSSMAKANGLEPTVSLQLHQGQLHREQDAHRDPLESTIGEICGKRGYLLSATWNTSQAEGATIFTFPLNSILSSSALFLTGFPLPANIAVINQFERWRCDFVFELYAVKTKFHTGRLLFTTAYGAPSITAGQENIFVNNVLEYSGENDWTSTRVRYNAGTEFLRTWDGPGAPDQVQDFSFGTALVTVANVLKATSEVVPTSIDMMLFVRCENVVVYEPKILPRVLIDPNQRFRLTGTPALAAVAEDEEDIDVVTFEAEGPMDKGGDGGVMVDTPETGGIAAPTPVDTTAAETNIQQNAPCKLDLGRKYEYCVADIHEPMRRHALIPKFWNTTKLLAAPDTALTYTLAYIPVQPIGRFTRLFSGYSGHLKFRIFVYGTTPGAVMYNAHPGSLNTKHNSGYMMVDRGYELSTWSGTTYVQNRETATCSQPFEMMYQVSNNCSFIDISVPFNSHWNMLPTQESEQYTSHTTTNGTIVLRLPPSYTDYEVFQALGDDFRFELFCPRNGISTNLATQPSGTAPTAGSDTEIGGFMP